MSKYKAQIRPGRLRRLRPVGIALVALLVLCSASDMFWSYFSNTAPIIFTSVIVLIAVCFSLFNGGRRTAQKTVPAFILFDDTGKWYQGEQEAELADQSPWQLTREARITPWGVYLHLIDADGQHHNQWILHDELPERDYRRLVRTIGLLAQHQPDFQL
ncbi:hypothetical protein HHX48_16330 [Salinimonas sp. HHU 13199]|uniref:DUF2244 domain-containing protein n=1 Tax=Salinimonas profundi TaxID=2729140 RepID=A0ABR8LTK3_9ALTE|nr:protein YgfX [Salinimonas profundi]MBD3587304.1 hypothetical protein [Salinimonas profundi]